MAIQLIESSDTLEAGFRVKANANFNEIIESVTQLTDAGGNPTGTFRLVKNGGGFIDLVLTDQFYTISQISTIISGLLQSPYSGAWNGSKTPYAAGSITDHNGTLWRANTSTSAEPGTDGTWDNVLNDTNGTEFDFPAGASLDYDINYGSDVSVSGLRIYAEQYYTDLSIDPTGSNIFIPYAITYFKITATNHIIVRKSDPGDHIKITVKL